MKLPVFISLLCWILLSCFLQAASYKLDLSGGTGGTSGQTTYYAPNGTVVTSSAPVYSNGSYYYMRYMFNGTYNSNDHYSYWLTSSSGNQTLTFAFNQAYHMDFVRVYPETYSDRKSNYQIEVSSNGINFTNITGGFINTLSDANYTYRDHSILNNITHARFTLTREKNWGVTMNEVEFYVSYPAVLSVNNPNFSNVRVGTSVSANLTVTNTGTSGSSMTGTINAASGEFSPTTGTQNFSLGSGQSNSRTFYYTPTSRGSDSATVYVSSNVGGANSTLSGTGVSPLYSSSLAPNTTIDFGTVDKDVTMTKTLTIQNTTPDADLGNLTNLTLLSATISGEDASFFALENFTPGTILSKNALLNLLITVTNSDHLVRNRYATLTIVTDENAAFGAAGNVYTYQLAAYTVPEASTCVFLSIACIFWGFSRSFRKTK